MMVAMINRFRQKIRDINTISNLCKRAEKQALSHGVLKPGVEHFVLASLTLEDGEAEKLLNSFDIGVTDFQNALQTQHREALREVGIDVEGVVIQNSELSVEAPKIFQAQPSSQKFIKQLYELNRGRSNPLNSLHVLEASVEPEYGVIKRAFDVLGVGLEDIRGAIKIRLSRVDTKPGI